jgi:hypothetical protein
MSTKRTAPGARITRPVDVSDDAFMLFAAFDANSVTASFR